MEQLLHLAKSLYMQHSTELALGLLACIIILMIINLTAVRRCRKQVRTLNEKTKEFMKLSLRQNEAMSRRSRKDTQDMAQQEGTGRGERGITQEDEEVFGSVIQEIFS